MRHRREKLRIKAPITFISNTLWDTMVKVNLSGSELVQLGHEESQPNCDTIWCQSCAEVHIWTEAEREVFGSEVCTECFYEVTNGLK